MNERDFQGWVLDVADRFGWRYWHVPAPMRAVGGGKFVPEPLAAGLPDLILMHHDPARLVFAELKGPKGRVSPEQREFIRYALAVSELTWLAKPGDPPYGKAVATYVWKPGDEDLIEVILRSKVVG